MGTQIAVNAQDLSVSDVQDSGCQRGTRSRANENETKRTIVLTKEGTILTVQILGFVSNCATEGFDITPNMSGGSDGEPVSVSLGVEPILPDVVTTCECPFNVSFTLHGLETNSFYFTCWWYEGQVNLTEGEPLTLESITEPVQIDDWYCIIDKVNHTAIVEGVDGATSELIIPLFLSYEGQEYYVTGIDEAAFLNDKTLSSVNIPTNLTHIGYYAFAYCSNLKDVYCFADQVPTTGSDVFQGTPIASATLHVPAGLIDKYKATAPWNEFGNIVGEGNVTIDGLNYYLDSSFYTAPLTKGNNWEGELDIPSEVSFYEQTYTVTCIAQAAFFDNSKLTKVRIPKSIEYIIRGYYTTNPYEELPTGLVSPDHMNPFMGCTALESIEVEEGNPGLKSVDGVLFSQDGKGYYYYQTNSYYGTGLYCYPAGARRESYTIPNGVEWIGSGAFEDNQYISTLTIPSSMKMMYWSVFAGCSNLKDIYCNAENVPVAFSFEDFPISSATLHVPAGSLEKYKATAPWNKFGNIVEMTTSGKLLPFVQDGKVWTYEVSNFIHDWEETFSLEGDTVIGSRNCLKLYYSCQVYNQNRLYKGAMFEEGGNVYIIVPDSTTPLLMYDFSCEPETIIKVGEFKLKIKEKKLVKYHDEYLRVIDYTIPENEDYPFEGVEGVGFLGGGLTCLLDGYAPGSTGGERYLKTCTLNGVVVYEQHDFYTSAQIIKEDDVTFTKDQMATIILPTAPDASKGKYYRLDRCEDGKIIFEQELQPQARIPYIIVPDEDFSIDPSTLDLAGLSPDTVSIAGISFIGTYTGEVLPSLGGDGGGSYYDIIDTTPDCTPLPGEGQGERLFIGALRAYLIVNWDDPYNHPGSKGPEDKLEIVLKDKGTSIEQMVNGKSSNGKCYDLQGRRLNTLPLKGAGGSGIYIVNGRKKVIK